MTKKIVKGAHEWKKGSRDGEYSCKQSTIGEGLGEQCNKGEYLICMLHFDLLNANRVPENAFDIVPDFSNENLVSKNGILGLPNFLNMAPALSCQYRSN
jgi:hypothetical protein